MYKYSSESLYIAGPECFYPDGFAYLASMRKEAEYYGFKVSLPNDNPIKFNHEDLRRNADAIFENCRVSMNSSTAIIADLEFFRGSEPDGGTVFEIGMAYALDLRCYAYTRDKRDTLHKYQGTVLKEGKVLDRNGRKLAYPELPFSPCIVSTCKIVEGDFGDCLKILVTDMEEERKSKAWKDIAGIKGNMGISEQTLQESGKVMAVTGAPAGTMAGTAISSAKGEAAEAVTSTVTGAAAEKRRPLIYLSGPERYDADALDKYKYMKEVCAGYGYDAVSPMDDASGIPRLDYNDPYTQACHTFAHWQQHVRSCDILLGNLNDFRGMEPSSDVSFECGMAWQLGKTCFGYMKDTSVMRKRIPHYGADRNYKDICGNEVENFNYPVNLMFASSMPVFEGDFEEVIKKVQKSFYR